MGSMHTRATSYLKTKLGILLDRTNAFTAVFGRIFVYRKFFVFETSIPKAGSETASKVEVDVRLAQSDDISRLVRFKALERGAVEERFEAGHLCFVAEKNGDIVFYLWVCLDDLFLDKLERKLRIGFDSAHFYSDYTIQEYRGMGIATVAMAGALDYLFRNGVKRVYGLISPNNIPSQRVVEKNGFRKMGEITLVKLFNLKRYKFEVETSKDCARLKEMFSI